MLFATPEPVRPSIQTVAGMPPHIYVVTATETTGPDPLLDFLDDRTLQRWDITEGRVGIPVTLAMQLVDMDNQGAAISGAEVYLRHGASEDSAALPQAIGALQGVQYTSRAGKVTFKTLYPGNHPGPRAHLQMQVLLPNLVPSSRTMVSACAELRFPHSPVQGERLPFFPLQPACGTLAMRGDIGAGLYAHIVIGITSAETGDVGYRLNN
jgi:protocatechuate 3,4-dioxygenase beta subunit